MKHVGLRMLGGVFLAVTALRSSPIEAAETAASPQVASAERQAEEGNLTGALASLLSVEPRISNASTGMGPQKDLALRVAARIIARADKPPFIGFPSEEEQTKWAYLQVRKQMETDPTPALRTDFGEIAARIPTERGEALKTLEDLEAQGTMGSSFGYATLARLRDEVGHDTAGVAGAPLRALAAGKRQVALARCHKTAKVASTCDKGLIPVTPPKG